MKKYFLLAGLITGLTVASCTNQTADKNNTADEKMIAVKSSTIDIATLGLDELETFNISEDIYHILDDKSTLSVEIKEETILDFKSGRNHSYVHVTPGVNLVLDTISDASSLLGVSGELTKENMYIASFNKIIKEQKKSFDRMELSKKEPADFNLGLTDKYVPVVKLIEDIQADNNVSDGFKQNMSTRYLANKGNDLMDYKPIYNYVNGEYPEIPEGFYTEISAIDFMDSSWLTFSEGRRLASEWHARDIDYEDYEDDVDYYKANMENAKSIYPNSLLAEYCNYDMLSNVLNFGGGIAAGSEMIDEFKGAVKNKYLLAKLQETIEPLMKLVAGNDAPDFIAKTRDGKDVMLSDLKGKKVYIDVWATWCGPCIKEIPSLKALENELHDENIEFVSVSIDKAKDKEKWMKFIEDKEMKGVQLMANGDWKSDVATSYNVKGIPHFILIDEEGKIWEASAPRPSDPNIKDLLIKGKSDAETEEVAVNG